MYHQRLHIVTKVRYSGFLVHELSTHNITKMFFDLSVIYCMEFLNETLQAYLTSKLTYCDKEPLL